VAINVPPPKYAVVVNAIQQRIEDGTYPPGAAIPSETQLINEFQTSRPTIVRALGILQQDGWIESQQGKGRFVKGRPTALAPRSVDRATDLLDQGETASVALLRVGAIMATNRAAAALELDTDTPVITRRRLVEAEIGPVELGRVVGWYGHRQVRPVAGRRPASSRRPQGREVRPRHRTDLRTSAHRRGVRTSQDR
jgi:GntR family transcriptional regulator